MSYNLKNKVFQFSDCISVFSIIVTISNLIEIEKNSKIDIDIENSLANNQDTLSIDYELIPNSNDRKISDLSYVHLSSAIICALLYYKYESDYDSLMKFWNNKRSLSQSNDSIIERVLEKAYEIYHNDKNNEQLFKEAFSSYSISDIVSSFDAFLVYNRIVHDNIMYCIINEPISESAFGKAFDNIINNQDIKRIIDEIINNGPPSGEGGDDSQKPRSSSLAKVYFDDKTTHTYLSVSGIWDRGKSKNPLIKRFLSKPALCLSTNDRTKIFLVNAISKAKNWEFCFLDHYTESYYSVFTLDKIQQKRYLLQHPMSFIDDLRNKRRNNQLNNKNQKYNGRLFSCGEKKIISYILYDKNFKKRNHINTITFFVDRKPCYLCEESLKHFHNKLHIKRLLIKYGNGKI